VLEAYDVSKRFPGVVALDHVSLQLHPGEVHALVGENGAGKSTLIKVLTGLHQPDEGEVRYLGEPVTFSAPRDAWDVGISTTYQEISLIPQMSVARNLFLGREPRTRLGLLDLGRMHDEAAALLSHHGIDVDVRREVGELGVAVQQMVAIVRAISTDARVVILDEPTSSLEPREVDQLAGVVKLLQQAGVALLYVSHKLDEVYRMCDGITVLRDGRRVHTGSVSELTRLQLVSKMLGRDVADLASHGVTGFDEEHDVEDRTVLQARGLMRRNVLHDVSLDIREGEVVALAGLLGSGRSETAKAIFGDQRLDGGSVEVGGRAVRSGSPAAAIAAGIALLPEDRKAEGLIPTLSVRDNIALAALPALTRMGVVSGRRVDEVVQRFMRRLRIKASSPDQKVSQLSGGNQQKVLLGRMLALDPRVLLLDEPTRGIDVGAKAEVQTLIDEIARDGRAVLLISSELEEVVEGADRVFVLKDGAIVGVLQGNAITESAIMSRIATAGDDGTADG
jgi:ribose transport system ATP-binding protein